MRLELVTAATVEPVSLAEAKLYCRIDDSAEDAVVTMLITTARKHVEDILGRQLVNASWRGYLDGFPASGQILIPICPLVSATSIKYLDSNGTEQTLAADQYRLVTAGEPGFIELADGCSWPTTQDVSGAVRVVFVAGYGASSTYVPEGLRLAIMMLVGHWFGLGRDVAISGTIVTQVPMTVKRLLDQYDTGWKQ